MYLVADNLQLTKPELARALSRRDPDPISRVVRQCEEAGAHAVDVNLGHMGRDAGEAAPFVIQTVERATDLPLFLDTADPVAMEAALRACSRPATVNGTSLEPRKLGPMADLAAAYSAPLVCFLLRPDGHVAANAEERLSIAAELVAEVTARGVAAGSLIIDPLAVPLIWDDGPAQAMEVAECIRLLPEVLGFTPRRMVGLSNLTTGRAPAGKKSLVERTWLAMLGQAGLDTVLLDVLRAETVRTARAVAALSGGGVFSWEAM
ncbi:MAG: dihydropteroate synthase [Desulfatibacillaceae bacterium]